MPILNYHKYDQVLPDMSKPQKCDGCGCEKVGNKMYFRYHGNNQIGVICRPCFQQVHGGPAPISAAQQCVNSDKGDSPLEAGLSLPAYQSV